MIGIPSYPVLLPVFAIFGFLVVSTSIYSLIKDEAAEKEYIRLAMASLAGSLFLLVGTIGSIGSIWSTYNFRNIDISQVTGLRVIKSEDEYKNDNSKFVVFDDAQSVQKVLQSLENCFRTNRNHESYQDGYKFQIIFAGENSEKDLYISVYRKSNNKTEKSVTIPHYYENKNLNLGEYNCPAFQDWVNTNINPLFTDKDNSNK